jgi:succinate-semialdehyde dehydrogenase/glutarate-semialdehyde dehydrogenase
MFIVDSGIADDFINMLTKYMHSKTVGDPISGVDVGPLARNDLKNTFLDQVDRAVAEGAAASRNVSPDALTKGFYVNPLVLTGVKPGSVADTEELFGPAAAVLTTTTDEEAISIANASRYGLGAAVFTSSSERANRFAAELECGMVFINDFVRSDARLPFGGVKDSGYGRELGAEGLLEFVNHKSVVET